MMNTLKLFGPPGTGKTHRLLQVMEQELRRGVAPERMAYLSFTVQARREALSRAMATFGFTRDQLPYFRTLHSICYRELEPGKQAMLIDNDDIIKFGQSLGLQFTPSRVDFETEFTAMTGNETGDRLLKFDHLRRHHVEDVPTAWKSFYDSDDLDIFMAQRFSKCYAEWKDDEGRYDFTDLLMHAHDPLPVDVVIVDEAQDFSILQWSTLKRLTQHASRMYVAGDDDQAIFTWAGASPESFRALHGKVEVLHQSYRTPISVHRIVNELISKILNRQPKTWNPRNEQGEVRFLLEPEQIHIPETGSVQILYRHHFQSREVEELLQREGLPYLKNDRPAPGLQWGKSIIAWERLRKHKVIPWADGQHIFEALSRGNDISPEGYDWGSQHATIGELTWTELEQRGLISKGPWFESLRKIPQHHVQYTRAVLRKYGNDGLTTVPRIKCTTIHASKGSEADHVFVIGDLAKKSHAQMLRDPDVERRVFYVGLTRARQSLTIVGSDNPILAPFFWRSYGR